MASAITQSPARSKIYVNGLAVLGFGLLALLGICALFAPWIAPFDPNAQDYRAILQGPSAAHWLGTDHTGRDMLSRLIYGSRVALSIGFTAVGAAVLIGGIFGLVAGYARGIVDEAIMRVMDALLAFPSVLLALGIMAALGPGITTIIIAIAVAEVPMFARITRSQVLSVRERDFVVATQAIGAGPLRIIFRHIVPHITSPVVVMATIAVGHAILTEAALSFLGLGIQPPTASWGAMMRNGFAYMDRAPWLSAFTGLFILLTVLALNLAGDTLRDRLDPRGISSR
ncbi:ABC transporter permease [Devosia sediminis]|uniref:ABC transporter permease n=1 Tax=Devosia sediminis TaxID=2798801 RepID=A0A934ITR0_9HYPH|nr:ABC transporter permease [Devosia sediminis]MBJ3784986.1 ABC transporter permease [Devosia sediminis]